MFILFFARENSRHQRKRGVDQEALLPLEEETPRVVETAKAKRKDAGRKSAGGRDAGRVDAKRKNAGSAGAAPLGNSRDRNRD